jgi:putative endonuclease
MTLPTSDDSRDAADGSRRALGAAGEQCAAEFLARRGYRIVARNVRADRVEIDLIAVRGGVCVFVEVKTRRGARGGSPEEAVDARKRERLVRGARAWLHARGAGRLRARFDVIAVAADGRGGYDLRHWPAAFDASGQ